MTFTAHIYAAAISAAVLLAAGCTSNDPVRVEQDFGKSVRQMIDAQIYDPTAAHNPPVDPPTQLDGNKAEAGLGAYREDVPRPEAVQQPLQIQISN